MKKPNEQKNQIAVSVNNLSKRFLIPHEKISSIKIAFINLFKRKSYESFYALKDVSFEIKKGEFFGILGRNGSGKSTLLKILAGVYTADKGSVKVNGLVSPFLELGIGFNPELSGRDNIYLNATVLGLTEKEIDEKFDSIVAFSELERFIDQKIKNYSSGMNVRLAFSVAIHANREILLMDEVLAVGDSNFQSKCLREFAKYKEQGKTVILVTHDISTVQRYCDRAMLLRNGEVMMIGGAEEVGNEYVYQNMSDEEKRIIKEQEKNIIKMQKDINLLKGRDLEEKKIRQEQEQKRLEEERKNKVAEITIVEFLDKDGKVRNVFETGEDLSVRIYFKKNKENKLLNFSLTIHDQGSNYFFGINSFIDTINIEKCIENTYFQVNFRQLPLKGNTYKVMAGLFGENELENYDFKQKPLQIFSKGGSHGSVQFDYWWN